MPTAITTSRQQRAAQVARDQAAAQRLTSAYTDTWARIKADLAQLTAHMEAARDAETGKVPVSWLYREQRLQRLQMQVAQQVQQFARQAHTQVSAEIAQATHEGARDVLGALQATVPPGIAYSFVNLPVGAVNALVAQADSGRLAKLFSQFAPDAASRARKALIQGVAVGDGPDAIARRLRDSLGIPLTRALTISRTETLTAYNAAQIATMRANSDVVSEWKWLTGPDPCPECAAEADTMHALDDDPPPAHPNCRCTSSAITKPWSEILGGDASDD